METDFNKRIRKMMINIALIGAVSIITYLLYSTIEKNKVISEKDKKIMLDSMTIVAKVKELKGIKAAYEILEQERDSFGLANDSLVAVVSTINAYLTDLQIKDSLKTMKIDNLNTMIVSAKKTLVKEKQEFNLIEKINHVDIVKTTTSERHYNYHKEAEANIHVKIRKLEIEPVSKAGLALGRSQFSHSHIKHIRIKFIIEKSNLTSTVQRIFSVQLQEPNGTFYQFNPDYDFIKIDGCKVHLTNKKKIEFDGNDTQVSFLYPKSTPFLPGTNVVKLFCENQLIAEKTFIVE